MNISTAIPTLTSALTGVAPSSTASSAGTSFSDLFKAAISNVDGLQSKADTGVSNMLQGAPGTDVGNVMVSVEKADVAFQLMMQVRNKVLSAYQEIEKMQF